MNTAEELIRFSPASLIGLARVATADFEIGGRMFRRDAFVLPITGAANRDPQVFAEPDRFDIAQLCYVLLVLLDLDGSGYPALVYPLRKNILSSSTRRSGSR